MKQLNNLRKNKSKAHGYRFTVGRILQIVLALVFLVFAGRFLYISISKTVAGENLTERTNQLYRKNQTLKATRGTIYDRNGIAIAEDSHVYTVYAVLDHSAIDYHNKPQYVVNKEKTAEKLAEVLPLSKERILKYLNPKKKSYQVEFGSGGSGLTIRQRHKIESFHLSGIKFIETPSRLYPNGNFASHVVGLAQSRTNHKTQNSTLVGTMGLEQYFNKQLSGKDGYRESFVDGENEQLPSGKTNGKQPVNGDSLYLTLDFQMQSYLEQLMSQVQTKYKPVSLTAVVEDIKTGKVLAASQRPTFNPQTKKGLSGSWRDMLVQDSYEPGSVFKVLSLAAAIQSGNYNPNATYRSGSITIGGSTIHDWNNSGWGVIPFSQAFPRSSNVGMATLEQKMGAKVWRQYLDAFHIGKNTGVTLPGEVPGILSFKTSTDQAVTSFGQGVNVTTMQMMQAFSSLGNNGQMVKPQFVNKIVSPNGKTVRKYKTEKVGKPVYSAATTKVILQNMKNVLNPEYGTGSAYNMPGQSIGVKTGTAQIANPKGGGYMTGNNNYIFSVVGVTPLNNQRYCIYITMKQPQKMTAAAETILASIFKPMMSRIILTASKHNSSTSASTTTVPSVAGKKVSEAEAAASAASLTPVVLGTGKTITNQSLSSGQKTTAGSKLLLNTGGKLKMPNIIGWTKAEVTALSKLTGLQVQFTGTGSVKKQSIKAGATITSGSQLKVELEE
jgi:penicillin-binding protein 2B